ncbi:ATP11 protein-domain-containing protein [Cunninghamella echinulata]|nr:ATP11 protein-domain-containing protein [Cunninghamella echinulata]
MLSTFSKRCLNRIPSTVTNSLVKHNSQNAFSTVRPLFQNRFRGFATEVKHNISYEEKYANKLKEAASKRGLTVEELKAKLIEEAQQKRELFKPTKKVTKQQPTSADKTAAAVKAKAQLPYESSAPTLDKIVKLELFEKEDRDTIEKIWTQYHADKDCITAIIPSDIYDILYKRSQKYPMFIVPMPREAGIEFFVLQFNFHQCHFTSLLEYKTKGTEARPYFTITHFPELSDSKGIVLMKGEITDDPRMIDTQNAQFLAFTLQQFYASGNQDKFKMVENFHQSPQSFDYEALIKEVEKVI